MIIFEEVEDGGRKWEGPLEERGGERIGEINNIIIPDKSHETPARDSFNFRCILSRLFMTK